LRAIYFDEASLRKQVRGVALYAKALRQTALHEGGIRVASLQRRLELQSAFATSPRTPWSIISLNIIS
jgi:hypothetical protein